MKSYHAPRRVSDNDIFDNLLIFGDTHIIPRMKKVIDGDDPGGATEATNWKGGGGFRYYRLGPSLIEKDKFGNPIISSKFNAAMLAEAPCKLEGFPAGISGTQTLATVTFSADNLGDTFLHLGADDDGLTEGFPLDNAGFGEITFEPGPWTDVRQT